MNAPGGFAVIGSTHHPFLKLVGDGTAWVCCRECDSNGYSVDRHDVVVRWRGPYPVEAARAKVVLHQAGVAL